MTRRELMELAWFQDAAQKHTFLAINGCIGFEIGEVYDSGLFTDLYSGEGLYLERRDDGRFRLIELDAKSQPLNTTLIFTVEFADREVYSSRVRHPRLF